MKRIHIMRLAAAGSVSKMPAGIGRAIAGVAHGLAALNRQLDEARARRDRVNEFCESVDRAYWIYLR